MHFFPNLPNDEFNSFPLFSFALLILSSGDIAPGLLSPKSLSQKTTTASSRKYTYTYTDLQPITSAPASRLSKKKKATRARAIERDGMTFDFIGRCPIMLTITSRTYVRSRPVLFVSETWVREMPGAKRQKERTGFRRYTFTCASRSQSRTRACLCLCVCIYRDPDTYTHVDYMGMYVHIFVSL